MCIQVAPLAMGSRGFLVALWSDGNQETEIPNMVMEEPAKKEAAKKEPAKNKNTQEGASQEGASQEGASQEGGTQEGGTQGEGEHQEEAGRRRRRRRPGGQEDPECQGCQGGQEECPRRRRRQKRPAQGHHRDPLVQSRLQGHHGQWDAPVLLAQRAWFKAEARDRMRKVDGKRFAFRNKCFRWKHSFRKSGFWTSAAGYDETQPRHSLRGSRAIERA